MTTSSNIHVPSTHTIANKLGRRRRTVLFTAAAALVSGFAVANVVSDGAPKVQTESSSHVIINQPTDADIWAARWEAPGVVPVDGPTESDIWSSGQEPLVVGPTEFDIWGLDGEAAGVGR